MLKDISRISSRRLQEVRSYMNMVRKLAAKTNPLTFTSEVTIAKGLFFVHLYGAYEYTVTAAVQKSIQIINASPYTIADCEPVLLSLVLNPQCDSLSDVGRTKTWERRWNLFEQIFSANSINIDDSLFPTDGKNIRFSQLESIWKTFNIHDPILPRMILKGRLEELVNNRNLIAHGTESPAVVGGRYSSNDLSIRFKDINELCTYIIQVFETYLSNEDYIK